MGDGCIGKLILRAVSEVDEGNSVTRSIWGSEMVRIQVEKWVWVTQGEERVGEGERGGKGREARIMA